jgi:hypothetical protein
MKKAAFLASALLFLIFVSPLQAVQNNQGQAKRALKTTAQLSGTPTPGQKNKAQAIWERLKAKFPKLLPAGLNRAEVISVSGTILPAEVVVAYDGKNVTLRLSQKTLILGKYSGKISLAEFKKGDIVSARGIWQDSETKAVLETRVLRNLSFQKRPGTFWGKITNVDKDSFTLETNKGALTVVVGSATKIVDRREQIIPFSSLTVGHRVRATGTWEIATKKMDPTRSIKDWSLGPVSSGTPRLTVTPY